MVHDPEDEVTVISAEGVQKGILHGNTITVVKEVAMEAETRPTVKLVGGDGNAFAVMAACRTAARKAGWSKERIDVLLKDMMAGDYDHLLGVAMREFDVE